MPPSTITSASDTFWQHTPTAPSAICFAAMTGDLWVLAWARRRTPDLGREVRHALQVALEGVEIDEERRRVHLRERHAGGGGLK